MPLIPALRKQKQVDLHEFKASQGYIVRTLLKTRSQVYSVTLGVGLW